MSDAAAAQRLAEACAAAMYAEDRASQGLGMSLDEVGPGRAVLSMTVREDMVNGHGVCHGGFVFTLADSACAFASNSHNRVNLLHGAKIDLLRPAMQGDRLRAEAREINRGARLAVYDVDVKRQDGKLVACFRGNTSSAGKALVPEDA